MAKKESEETALAVKPETLRKDAHKHFGNMQKSWFLFARTLHVIQAEEAYKAYGAETFKEFCASEYPSLSWPTIFKFMAVVESWGKALEAKLEKDESFQLPTYESCYRLTVVEDKIPKEEVTKLRKQVIDNKLSYQQLQERLKAHLDDTRKKIRSEVEKSTDEIEKELLADLRKGGEESEDGFLPARGEAEDVSEDDAETDGFDAQISSIKARATYLRENIPAFQKALKAKGEVTEEVVELANDLEALAEVINKLLDQVEDLSS